MNILNKFALNRLIKILSDFFLRLIDIIVPGPKTDVDNPDVPKPNRKPILPWRRKEKDENNI
jgi:hypothetical protein